MIKIKSWFSKEIQDEYLEEIGVEIKSNNIINPKFKEYYKKRFSELRKKEFNTLSNAEKKEYKQNYLKRKKVDIEFLPGKKIDLRTLLIGTREEVFKVDGIKEYFGIIKFNNNLGSLSMEAFLNIISELYPDKIKVELSEDNEELIYTYDTYSVSVPKNSNKRISYKKMSPFYIFFLKKIEIALNQNNYSFKQFKTELKNTQQYVQNSTLINYDLISEDMRHKLLKSLKIKCCPYCNRQYITIWYDENNSVHSTADLDHFYQKTIYPLFALSLFNFVPSCQICNSRMKGSKTIKTLYPYEEGMDEFKFRCKPNDDGIDDLVDFWLANKTNDPNMLLEKYKLELFDNSDDDSDVKHIQRIKGSKEVFHLEEVYQTHLEAAINEMLKIRIYFSGDYSKYAKKTLDDIGLKNENQHNDSATKDDSSNHSESKFSEDEMRNIILGFVYDGQDILDQPLGKMLSDILENELENKQIYD